MTAILRLRVGWNGSGVIGPGVSTFYSAATSPAALRAAVSDFFTPFLPNIPATVNLVIPPTGEELEDSTGEVTDVWSDGSPILKVGIDTGAFAAGVGCRIQWATNGVTNNRRVRGSTYIVPLGSGAYDSNGTLHSTVVGYANLAANDLIADLVGGLVVWTRPINDAGGKIQTVTAGSCPDRVSWLRSRRT